MFHFANCELTRMDQRGPYSPSIKEQQARLPAATAGVHRGAVADHIDLQLPRMATWPAAEVWMGFFMKSIMPWWVSSSPWGFPARHACFFEGNIPLESCQIIRTPPLVKSHRLRLSLVFLSITVPAKKDVKNDVWRCCGFK